MLPRFGHEDKQGRFWEKNEMLLEAIKDILGEITFLLGTNMDTGGTNTAIVGKLCTYW